MPREACPPGFGVYLSPTLPSPTGFSFELLHFILDTQTFLEPGFGASPSGSWGALPVQRLQQKGLPGSGLPAPFS